MKLKYLIPIKGLDYIYGDNDFSKSYVSKFKRGCLIIYHVISLAMSIGLLIGILARTILKI